MTPAAATIATLPVGALVWSQVMQGAAQTVDALDAGDPARARAVLRRSELFAAGVVVLVGAGAATAAGSEAPLLSALLLAGGLLWFYDRQIIGGIAQ